MPPRPLSDDEPTVAVTVQVPKSLKAWLLATARDAGISMSGIFRKALDRYRESFREEKR